MRGIRTFQESDIPSVITLHCDAFGNRRPQSATSYDAYARWLTTVFVDNPMRMVGVESIVFEDDGDIIGFLGIVARRVLLDGRHYTGSVCSNFCVHPGRRGGIGAQLLAHYRNMPQDVAFVDEVRDRAGALFERSGWVVSPTQSVRWVLPLRPAERGMSTLRYRVPASVISAMRPAAQVLDAALRSVPRSPFRVEATSCRLHELTPDELGTLIHEFGAADDLRPDTEDGSTKWLVERARGMSDQGELQMVRVDGAAGEVVGWFLYYAMLGGQGEVLQLVATRAGAREVLGALARHAYDRGVLSLSGTLQPSFLPHLAERRALFDSSSGSRWMLVHSRHPSILEAFFRGHLLLSRLDGEWCHHLR